MRKGCFSYSYWLCHWEIGAVFQAIIISSFEKMIGRLVFRNLLRYSQQQAKKNVFVLPKVQFIKFEPRSELYEITKRAESVNILSVLLRDNINFVCDKGLSYMYLHMAEFDLQIDQSFDTIMSPITQEYVKAFQMANTTALGDIAISCAQLKVENQALWEVILAKLDGENLCRYLTLRRTFLLLDAMVNHGKYVSHPLVAKLQKVIYEQREYYNASPEMVRGIREIVAKMGKMSKSEAQLKLSEAYQQIQ